MATLVTSAELIVAAGAPPGMTRGMGCLPTGWVLMTQSSELVSNADVQLLLWPVLPEFDERIFAGAIVGGDADVVNLYTALCALHAEMCVSEMI